MDTTDPAESGPVAPAAPPAAGADELEEMRNLLFGVEKRQLSTLQQRFEDPVVHAQDVSEVLPQAVTLCTTGSDRLARALTPAVESALRDSVRRHPAVLAAAIFPVLGPAVRKSIAETLARLVESLNEALDHSFSIQGLKWRWEAARSGLSFAEVVMRHTLIYRVEQVLLIHRQTGLLLHHVWAPQVVVRDGPTISGMLTAIREFVEASFCVEKGENMQTLQVGGLNVWTETGPQAVLAAVIRGHAPADLHSVLQQALERIHQELGPALSNFTGRNTPFLAAGPCLEDCLLARTDRQRKRVSWKPVTLGVAFVAGLAIWGVLVMRENGRWGSYLQRLRAEPGIVVTEAAKHWGRFHVAGLRDPLAKDPIGFLSEFGLDTNMVVGRWEPYLGLSPEIILRRATMRLDPPAGTLLRLQDGVLYAEGVASKPWIDAARRRVETLPGVLALNTEGLLDDTLTLLAASVREVESTRLFFDDTTHLVAGQDATVGALLARLNELRQVAAREGKEVRVAVVGHTDEKGTAEYNQRLSRQRAEFVCGLLTARGIPASLLRPLGVGIAQPLRPGLSASEQTLNRRVSFRVQLGAPAPAPTQP